MPSEEFRRELLRALPDLQRYAASLCPSLAEDLAQETALRAWQHWDKFQSGTNMRAWLFTNLRNLWFTVRLRERRNVEDPEGVYAAGLHDHPDQEAFLMFEDHRDVLELLSPKLRQAAILFDLEGRRLEECAAIVGVPCGTIKSRLFRAREQYA